MIEPLRGIENEIKALIENRQYFLIHAPRQSGKTTLLHSLAWRITHSAHICIAKKTIKSILINQLLLKLTLNFNCKIWIIDRENQTFTNPKLIVFR